MDHQDDAPPPAVEVDPIGEPVDPGEPTEAVEPPEGALGIEPGGSAAASDPGDGADPADGTAVTSPSGRAADDPRERGLVEVVRRRIPDGEEWPIALLTAVVATWGIVVLRLIHLRHARFATFDFDEGIYDQYIWNLSHFRQGNTVRGVPFFGHHASFAFVLLIPFAWLGGGVDTWNALHVLALAGTAFPLYLLARDKLGSAWWGLVAGLAWLGQPTVAWLVHEGFHPDGMALPTLVGTYLLGERWIAQRRTATVAASTRWGFVACFLLTISWKEDLALALFGMGLVWVIRREWRFARWVLAAATGWFVLFGVIMVPHVAGGGTVYGGIYDLGSTPSEIIENSVRDPSRVVDKLDENNAVGYGRGLTESWGFTPLASPVTLLIGAPQMATNIISASGFTWDLKFHYQAVPVATMAISSIEGLAFLRRRRRAVAEAAGVVLLVAALACSSWYGPLPFSNKYRVGYWPLTEQPVYADYRAALALVPDDGGTSAGYLLVSHLTHREVIYTFPNPWRPSNYGVKPGVTGDPAEVDWIVLNVDQLRNGEGPSPNLDLYESIRASGEFEVRFERGPVVVLERVEPPGEGAAPIDVGE